MDRKKERTPIAFSSMNSTLESAKAHSPDKIQIDTPTKTMTLLSVDFYRFHNPNDKYFKVRLNLFQGEMIICLIRKWDLMTWTNTI